MTSLPSRPTTFDSGTSPHPGGVSPALSEGEVPLLQAPAASASSTSAAAVLIPGV